MISAIATGKTLFALLKVFTFCQKFPDSLALVVRKEFTDLRDSTIKDFETYFGVTLTGDKEYTMPNGSCIMFRHGAELNVLKNINLSMFLIEQAEEFETAETFIFLRDRLRRKNSLYRQGIIIGNTNAHNWIWSLWKNNPPSAEYDLYEANTFDNAENLPADFIADLEAMKLEAPSHYSRYVMNSWEDTSSADLLIPFKLIEESTTKKLLAQGQSILSVDVARFGDNETVFNIIQRAGGGYKQTYLNAVRGQDLMSTTGRIVDLYHTYKTDFHVIDDIGLGGGVTDRLREMQIPRVYAFKSNEKSLSVEFQNRRDECYWRLKELFEHGQIQLINDDKLKDQLSTIKFEYRSNGQKTILSKDKMKKEGYSSPDRADALMMSCLVLKHLAQKKLTTLSMLNDVDYVRYRPKCTV